MATQTVNQPDTTEDQPLNIHELYRMTAVCGYDRDLTLMKWQAGEIAARLRGVDSITALLMAEGDFVLSSWMRNGLLEAIHALNSDTRAQLERINERAEKAEKATA